MGQPRALATLFLTEMWERFSYYGMRAILVLYLIAPLDGQTPPGQGLGFTLPVAAAIYGAYSSLIYLLPIAGGWVADRLTGPRRAVLFGGIVIALGHFTMAVPIEVMFWIGLVAVAIGTGLLKPSISAIVGDLYAPHDTRRDGGFSLFYMGINLGAFIAPLVVGFLADSVSYHVAFAAAGVGMLIGLIQYVAGGRGMGEAGKAVPKPATPEGEVRRLAVARTRRGRCRRSPGRRRGVLRLLRPGHHDRVEHHRDRCRSDLFPPTLPQPRPHPDRP